MAILEQNSRAPASCLTPQKRLTHKAKMAANLLALGETPSEVARVLDLTEAHVKALFRSQLFQIEIERARDKFIAGRRRDLTARIHALADKAVDTVEEVMNEEQNPGATRLAAADRILDRVVPKKTESEASKGTQINIVIGDKEVTAFETAVAEYQKVEPGFIPDDPELVEDEKGE